MPSWTYNHVTISGVPKSVSALKRRLAGETAFDFNKLLRMPEGLNIECSSRTDLGIACFDKRWLAYQARMPWFEKNYPRVQTPAQLRKVLEAKTPEVVTLGRQAAQNIQEHGNSTWYDWCSENWGTKWNAHNVEVVTDEPTTVAYKFDSAWCAPYPLRTELRRLCRELNLVLAWTAMDEDDTGTYDVLTGAAA